MSDNGWYVTTSIFFPLTPHRVCTYRLYVRAIDKDSRKNMKTSLCLMYDYKSSFSIRRPPFQAEILRVQVSTTRARIVCWNVPVANQPSHASAKETIHLSLAITLVVHLYTWQRKRKKRVAAAGAAAVEHRLLPLGESYYVNYSLIDLA